MLRLSSQRAVKTLRSPLCNPLRNPLPSPLCKPLQIRHVHIEQAPFSGPPGYATITQRFSSYPNPLYFFTEKRAKERIERGEFVDIHDIGRADPKDYDVLITDVDDSILRSQISELVGVPYLQEATKEEANKVVETGSGFLYGRNSQTIFPCVVSYNGDARWIFFIVDSGSPLTYLSAPAGKLLGLENYDPAPVTIAGYQSLVQLSPKDSHFANLNILGSDFFTLVKPCYWPDYKSRRVTFYFGDKWEPKPKL